MRDILDSSQGTLKELDLSPLITSSMIMKILVGAKIIEFDRELYEAVTKVFSILISFGEALPIWRYYNVCAINCMILIFELVFIGLMVLVLDEISKGYGLDSGISLFIAKTISENIMLKSFSHLTIISE